MSNVTAKWWMMMIKTFFLLEQARAIIKKKFLKRPMMHSFRVHVVKLWKNKLISCNFNLLPTHAHTHTHRLTQHNVHFTMFASIVFALKLFNFHLFSTFMEKRDYMEKADWTGKCASCLLKSGFKNRLPLRAEV